MNLYFKTDEGKNQLKKPDVHQLSHFQGMGRVLVEQNFKVLCPLHPQGFTQRYLPDQPQILDSIEDTHIHAAMVDTVREGVDISMKVLVILASQTADLHWSYESYFNIAHYLRMRSRDSQVLMMADALLLAS